MAQTRTLPVLLAIRRMLMTIMLVMVLALTMLMMVKLTILLRVAAMALAMAMFMVAAMVSIRIRTEPAHSLRPPLYKAFLAGLGFLKARAGSSRGHGLPGWRSFLAVNCVTIWKVARR